MTPASAQAARFCAQIVGAPALVGVDDEFCPRRGAAHRRDPLAVIVATAKLHLEQGPRRCPLRRLRHRRRSGERNRIGRDEWHRRNKPGQFVRPAAGLLRVNVPVSTIECITGSAGGHGVLQGSAVEAPPQRRAHGFDGRHNAVRGFAVACVGDGLAAAAVGSIAQFGHHHDGLGLAAAADREGAGQWPALDPYGELHARGKYDRSLVGRSRAVPRATGICGAQNRERRLAHRDPLPSLPRKRGRVLTPSPASGGGKGGRARGAGRDRRLDGRARRRA